MAKVKIEAAYCKSCGLCVSVCKKDVLEISESTNSMGYHYIVPAAGKECIGCCQCALFCPEGAIEVFR